MSTSAVAATAAPAPAKACGAGPVNPTKRKEMIRGIAGMAANIPTRKETHAPVKTYTTSVKSQARTLASNPLTCGDVNSG